MTLRIVAAGSGRRAMQSTRIVAEVLKLTKPHGEIPSMVYIGTATYDRDDPYLVQTNGFRALCRMTKLNVSELSHEIPTTEEIRTMLSSADVILVSGGNTLYAMQRWKQLGIDDMMHQLAKQESPPVFCGGSAGAICWFEYGHSDSMDPTTFLHVDPNLTEEQKKNWKFIRVKGLGFLQALCVPHHDATQSNGLPRSLDSDAMLLQHPAQNPCLGIDECAALVVNNGKAHVVSGDDGRSMCHIKLCQRAEGGKYEIVTRKFRESHGAIQLEDLWAGHVSS